MPKPILNLSSAHSTSRSYYFVRLTEFFDIVRMDATHLQDMKVMSQIADKEVRALIITDSPEFGDMRVVQYGHFEIPLDSSSDCMKIEKFLCGLGIRSVIDKSEYRRKFG